MTRLIKIGSAIILSAMLTGCYETGSSEGSNNIVINGSLLKGALNNADIKVYDSHNRIIWQGSSDNQGDYSADLASNQSNLFTVEAKAVQGSSMVCDAVQCIAPLSANSYSFGQSIDASELGALVIKNVFYLADASNPTIDRNINNQINGMANITYEVIKPQLSADTTQAKFENIATNGSSIVMAALGIENSQRINLTNIQLVNLNDGNTINLGANVQTALALFNGGFAANIELPNLFADALINYIVNQDDEAAKNTLISLQQQFAELALQLASYPGLNIDNQDILLELEQILEQGIDFTTLNQAIDEYTIGLSHTINRVSASSTHWSGLQPARVGQWRWVSSQGADSQWLQLNYGDAINPSQLAFAIDANLNLEQAQLQALNSDEQWQQLASLNQLTNVFKDERQVTHALLTLELDSNYQAFRLLFANHESIKLEYACLKQSVSNDFGCDNPLPAHSYQTSSSKLNANLVTNPQSGTWWISQMATNQPQWLAINYQQGFNAKKASIVVKQSNQGKDARLQGSNDGQNWQNITSLEGGTFAVDFVDNRNFRHLEINFNHNSSYSHYRYYSEPTSFVWLEYLSFQ